jgi:phenylacetate-coenzyme A ligase PaaK-like adenylate-forming protein
MVVCGMGNVGPWVFADLLQGVPVVADEWQAVVTHDGRRDTIELRVECETAATADDVQRTVLANLETKFPDFWKNLVMDLYQIKTVVMEGGTLRQDRKLRRVVDRRDMLITV